MDLRMESPLELIASPPEGERVLFTASVCPLRPLNSVKFFLGKENEVGLMYPGILEDIGESKPVGPVYHLAMGRQYPQFGALQVSLAYPILAISQDLAKASVSVLYATSPVWVRTHLVCTQEGSARGILQDLLPLVEDSSIPLTVWCWSL
jgi:hypothetical protein